MFIFRVEHNRDVCSSPIFRTGGQSITGHGTFRADGCSTARCPNFGHVGMPPYRMMAHERCAVTAEQWADWVGTDTSCQYTTADCYGSNYCDECPIRRSFQERPNWDIVAYWVEDHMKGTDWRIDNGQIIFNPAFAINMGVITYDDFLALSRDVINF
jgi:hypothetical protein